MSDIDGVFWLISLGALYFGSMICALLYSVAKIIARHSRVARMNGAKKGGNPDTPVQLPIVPTVLSFSFGSPQISVLRARAYG